MTKARKPNPLGYSEVKIPLKQSYMVRNGEAFIVEEPDTVRIDGAFVVKQAKDGALTFVAPVRGAFDALSRMAGKPLVTGNDPVGRAKRKA